MDPESRVSEFPRRKRSDATSAWNIGNGEDLELALRAAERLLSYAEERMRHEQNRTFAIISVITGTTLSLIASLIAVFEFANYGSLSRVSLGALITSIGSFVILAFMVRALYVHRRRATLDRTLQIAAQLSSIVSEALITIAERENWSYLRLQSTKLRLSVFPLIDVSDYSRRRIANDSSKE